MTPNKFHKIISPIYFYALLFLLYFAFRETNNFVLTKWNDYLFVILAYILPFLMMIWFFARLRKSANPHKWIDYFFVSALPGLFPGAITADGLWAMGHGETIGSWLMTIIPFGIVSAICFGIIGTCACKLLPKLRHKL